MPRLAITYRRAGQATEEPGKRTPVVGFFRRLQAENVKGLGAVDRQGMAVGGHAVKGTEPSSSVRLKPLQIYSWVGRLNRLVRGSPCVV